ncbi:MAG: hypothetical protein AAFY19_06480 [Pseudomonadota bacterium]
MDTAKLRLAAGAVAAVFGIVGLSALACATALALEPALGMTVSVALVGATLFVIAAGCLFFVTRPDKSTEDEVDKIGELTAEALADLPFDTVKALIEKRPMASLAIAVTTGYALSKDPERAAKNLSRVMTGLM